MFLPGRANEQPSGDSSIEAERIAPRPPRRWRTPSSASIPDGTQGLTRRPSLTLAAPASNQVPGALAKPVPSSQTQRSACSVPQLWPIIPGQPEISSERPATSSVPSNSAFGTGATNLVRGSGAA